MRASSARPIEITLTSHDIFEALKNDITSLINAIKILLERIPPEMAADIIMSLLLIGDASRAPELFNESAKVYNRYAASEIERHYSFVMSASADDLADYRK